jgi:hypothetical protein
LATRHPRSQEENILLIKNKKRAYALVLVQCSTKLNSKIKGLDGYVQADADQDVVQLLTIIQGYCYPFDNHQQSIYALEGAKHQVSTFYQSYNATTTDYMEHFKALVSIVETYGDAYRNEPGVIKAQLIAQRVATKDLGSPNSAKLEKALVMRRGEYLSCMIL